MQRRNFVVNYFRPKSDDDKLKEARDKVAAAGKDGKISAKDMKRLIKYGDASDREIAKEQIDRLNTKETNQLSKHLVKQTMKNSKERAKGLDAIGSGKYESYHWDGKHDEKDEFIKNSKKPFTDEHNHKRVKEAQAKLDGFHDVSNHLKDHIKNNLLPNTKKSSDKKALGEADANLKTVKDVKNLKEFHQEEKSRKEVEKWAKEEIEASRKAEKQAKKTGSSLSGSSSRGGSIWSGSSRSSGSHKSSTDSDGSRGGSPSTRNHNDAHQKAQADVPLKGILKKPASTTDGEAESSRGKGHDEGSSSNGRSNSHRKSDVSDDEGSNRGSSHRKSNYNNESDGYESSSPRSKNGSPRYNSVSPDSVLPDYSTTYDDLDEIERKRKASANRRISFRSNLRPHSNAIVHF